MKAGFVLKPHKKSWVVSLQLTHYFSSFVPSWNFMHQIYCKSHNVSLHTFFTVHCSFVLSEIKWGSGVIVIGIKVR